MVPAIRFVFGVFLIAIPLYFFVNEGFQVRDGIWTFFGCFFVWLAFRERAVSPTQKKLDSVMLSDDVVGPGHELYPVLMDAMKSKKGVIYTRNDKTNKLEKKR